MKIKDILNNNWNFKTRLLIARRIMSCTTLMKKEIANWKRTGAISDRVLSLQANGVEEMTISVSDLVNTYGMDPLSAMLFFDDLIKANLNEDKTRLVDLIQMLQGGAKKKKLSMTSDMLENIKNNQPELWNEYERLQKIADADIAKSEEGLNQIEDADLPE